MSYYKVLNPIAYSGRINRGEVVSLPKDIAKRYANDLEEVTPTKETEEALAEAGIVEEVEATEEVKEVVKPKSKKRR